jgi:AcrR family transcriptional regulator
LNLLLNAAVEPKAPDEVEGVPVRGRGRQNRSKRVKSQLTHDKLCNATVELLSRKALRSIKVAEIAQAVGVAPATFYIYFADVEEVVLAAIARIEPDVPDFPAIIEALTLETLEEGLRAFVAAYLAFWDEHFSLLRTRNLSADEGEPRFRAARARMLGPTLDALARKLADFRQAEVEAAGVRPRAAAAVIMGQMERLAAIVRFARADQQMSRQSLVDASVFIICNLMRRSRPSLGTSQYD